MASAGVLHKTAAPNGASGETDLTVIRNIRNRGSRPSSRRLLQQNLPEAEMACSDV
jgi:hypothetical protein